MENKLLSMVKDYDTRFGALHNKWRFRDFIMGATLAAEVIAICDNMNEGESKEIIVHEDLQGGYKSCRVYERDNGEITFSSVKDYTLRGALGYFRKTYAFSDEVILVAKELLKGNIEAAVNDGLYSFGFGCNPKSYAEDILVLKKIFIERGDVECT